MNATPNLGSAPQSAGELLTTSAAAINPPKLLGNSEVTAELSPALAKGKPRVALLVHQVWPFLVPVMETVRDGVGEFIVFASVSKEPNRQWHPDFGTLKVVVQKSINIASKWKHPLGFSDDNYLHFPLDTYTKLQSYRPDVIISFQLGFRSLMAAVYRALHPHTRLILSIQMTEHQQRGAGFVRIALRRFLLKYADRLIANGQSALRVLTSLGYPESRVTIIRTVCSLEQFMEMEQESSWATIRKLVYVGRLVSGKGLMPFLELLNQAVAEHPDLIVEMNFVGYGHLTEELAGFETCDRLKVIVRGPVEMDERHTAYRHGHVFVFPSLSDEWGLVVNEAMAAGLPICGSVYSQAVMELIEEGQNGWLFDPFDRASMLQGLNRMLFTSAESISAMGQNARVKIAEFDPVDSGTLHLGLIKSVQSQISGVESE